MSDPATNNSTNSKLNLIEVQHVGVTAKLQSPSKDLMLSYSFSTDSEHNQILTETTNEMDSTASENSKILYEMKSVSKELMTKSKNPGMTPSKIEFQLYTKPQKRLHKMHKKTNTIERKKLKQQHFATPNAKAGRTPAKENSLLQSFKNSFRKMKRSAKQPQPVVDKLLTGLPEPQMFNQQDKEIRIGMYSFEYGCAEYLKTHDCPPQVMSLELAEKATHYATLFWAEVFGSLQIAVSFLVAFVLQSYRFVLYSVVNILLVECLHMTSDYFIKPLLAVAFNGFIQPPLIFCFNILSLMRDILQPIAATINNFMKPIATVGRSIRLIHASYNRRESAAKTV